MDSYFPLLLSEAYLFLLRDFPGWNNFFGVVSCLIASLPYCCIPDEGMDGDAHRGFGTSGTVCCLRKSKQVTGPEFHCRLVQTREKEKAL